MPGLYSNSEYKFVSNVRPGKIPGQDRVVLNIWRDKGKEFSHTECQRLINANPKYKLEMVNLSRTRPPAP